MVCMRYACFESVFYDLDDAITTASNVSLLWDNESTGENRYFTLLLATFVPCSQIISSELVENSQIERF